MEIAGFSYRGVHEMTGLVGSSIRRIAGLFGVVAAVGLVAVPVALANNDTINVHRRPSSSRAWSTASPSCHRRHVGDDRLGRRDRADDGDYQRQRTQLCRQRHAHVRHLRQGPQHRHDHVHRRHLRQHFPGQLHGERRRPPPQFTECPAVDQNTGCQFLITVNNSTETVLNDPNQGPYEASEDSLIGVLNNSSSPVSELPLAVPGSDLFSFDGDGICNPGGPPVPSGCAPQPGTPAGTDCTQGAGGTCAFPVPSGEPAGYIEPGGSTGVPQNGYEGPTSWFSNVSTDTSSGVVHFSPALQPGQSTYFGLEEPPVGTTIGVGGTGAPSRRDVPADRHQHRRELLSAREPERTGHDLRTSSTGST